MRQVVLVVIVIVGLPFAVVLAGNAQPYAGLETRAIKALSEEQIADLRAGRGMGLALAAELNGYPGPRHVIDLAEHLELTEAQRAEVQALFDAMRAETIPIGEMLIERETELERQFAERTVTPASVSALTEAIGDIQGTLRAAHLRYHLATLDALTPEQVERYTELRGYKTGATGQHLHPMH